MTERLDRLAASYAQATDVKGDYFPSHAQTVAVVAVRIAEQVGLGPRERERLQLAGLVHDVGKLGIPDEIITKPGPLTDAEYEVIKTHSEAGERLVAAMGLAEEATWVRHHHERLDGEGYPDRLAGTDIPIASRILFVADAFDVITTDRPYRRGRSEAVAVAELQQCAGTQFEPDCVAALSRALGLT